MPTVADEAWTSLPPDWVCEVLSPGTRTYDLTEKRDIYAEHGVRWLWFVDPAERVLEAFALREGAWVLLGALHDEAEVRLAPFDAVAFGLGALWGP
jgi:Uma2 family endonuclease